MSKEQDFIITRRSIRKYSGKKIDESVLEIILKAGMYAPSAHNTQPWHFIVIRNRSIINEIPKLHKYAEMTKDADAVILVCADTKRQSDDGYYAQDCSAATQNILLSAHIEGLGACWLGVYPQKDRMEKLKHLLNLKDNLIPFSMVALGYPAEKKKNDERFDVSKIDYIN